MTVEWDIDLYLFCSQVMEFLRVKFVIFIYFFMLGSSCQGANQVILTCGSNEEQIQGPAGPPGKKGPPGMTGPRGLQGVKGEPGTNDTWKDTFATMEAKVEMLESDLQNALETIARLKLTSCKDAKSKGFNKSGVFLVFSSVDYQAYCDMETDGGGWLVIQKRYDGSTDFYKSWDQYVNGFGSLTEEFWIGLQLMHKLTAWKAHELRIDLENFDSTKVYAKYSNFSIGSADTFYRLTVGGYSGNAGDKLSHHNLMPFTTKDQDHDRYSENCAVLYVGAWWYNQCHVSNLNGKYFNEESGSATSNRWNPVSRKSSEMKIRPIM